MAQVIERMQQKSPDIIFIGLGMPYDSVVEILAMLSGNNDELVDSENNEDQLATLSAPITAPIYVVSETPLGSSQSRRLDLPADQILLFNKDDKSSLEKILNLK
mgnify:FL=1